MGANEHHVRRDIHQQTCPIRSPSRRSRAGRSTDALVVAVDARRPLAASVIAVWQLGRLCIDAGSDESRVDGASFERLFLGQDPWVIVDVLDA